MGAAHSTPAGDANPSSNPDPLSQLAQERDRVLHLDVLVDALRVACLEGDEAIDCLSRLVDLASVTHAHRARPINTRHTVPDSFATMTLARGKAPGALLDDVSSSLKHPETAQSAIALLRSVARAPGTRPRDPARADQRTQGGRQPRLPYEGAPTGTPRR